MTIFEWFTIAYLVMGIYVSGMSFAISCYEHYHSPLSNVESVVLVILSCIAWPIALPAIFHYITGGNAK